MKSKTESSAEPAEAEAQLDRICVALSATYGAVKGRALSKNAVIVGGKIVAFITRGRLVVKLPPDRIAMLVASGEATPMRMGTRVMREWVSVGREVERDWIPLAEESAKFVASNASLKRSGPSRRAKVK